MKSTTKRTNAEYIITVAILFTLSFVVSLGAICSDSGDGAALAADDPITPGMLARATGWTADEMVRGLDRLDRLYQFEMRTAEGRARWHGRVVRRVSDARLMATVTTHEDGETFTDRVDRAAAPAPVATVTNGVPAALAAARARRAAERAATNEVSVTVGGIQNERSLFDE